MSAACPISSRPSGALTSDHPLGLSAWPTWFWSGAAGLLDYALAFWFYLRGLGQVRAGLAGAMLNRTRSLA